MVERWCAATPDDFTFDVKLHQLFSFHSTPVKLLPPDLQSRAETDAKGKVKPTRDMQEALLKAFLRATAIFRSAGKMGVLLLQLSPAFSPRKHELNELEPLIEMLNGYELAIEFRNRNWAIGDQLQSTIDFRAEARSDFCERGRARIGPFHRDAIGCGRSDKLKCCIPAPARAQRKSLHHGQNRGGAFRLRLQREGNRGGRGAQQKTRKGSARAACDFQQQQSRLRAARGASSAQGAWTKSSMHRRRHWSCSNSQRKRPTLNAEPSAALQFAARRAIL